MLIIAGKQTILMLVAVIAIAICVIAISAATTAAGAVNAQQNKRVIQNPKKVKVQKEEVEG